MTADTGTILARKALTAAWMSVGLGLVMQAVVMLVTWRWPGSLAVELLGRISWSVFVCTALVVGAAAAQWRAPFVGVLGLLAAPSAFALARIVQKSLAAGLGAVTVAASAGPGPIELAIAKGLQYGAFGLLISAVVRREAGLGRHLAVGASVGLAMAVYLVVRSLGGASASLGAVVGPAVNEVLFPVGCSAIVWTTNALGKAAGRR